jgi:hypothetical protein
MVDGQKQIDWRINWKRAGTLMTHYSETWCQVAVAKEVCGQMTEIGVYDTTMTGVRRPCICKYMIASA